MNKKDMNLLFKIQELFEGFLLLVSIMRKVLLAEYW
mgnify:CR=1 FL=1